MSRITLKDVAAQAGVSYQTVSKVLNNKATVSSETEARIWDAVKLLDYKPDISARNLRTGASNLIGYAWRLSKSIHPHPILDLFLSNAAKVVEAHDYHLLTFLIDDDEAFDISTYQSLYARNQVRGFLLADTNHNDPRIAYLIEQGIPFASFGRANDAWDYCWVDVDGRFGMKSIVAHLVERGHQHIALLAWPEGSRAGEEREYGYLDGLQTANLPINPNLIYRGENTVRSGFEVAAELLALPAEQRPTAIACVSDMLAIGAMNAVRAAGLRVGEDIAITGFDDVPMGEFLYPALTSVRQPIAQVGTAVIDLLLTQINGQTPKEKGILLKPDLVIRQSS